MEEEIEMGNKRNKKKRWWKTNDSKGGYSQQTGQQSGAITTVKGAVAHAGTVVKQWTGGAYGGYTFCDHWRDEVKVGGYTVVASGHRGMSKKGGGLLTKAPDAGIYLYHGWANTLSPFTGCGMATPSKWVWPFLVADWPDMGVMDEEDTKALLKVTEGLIKKGKTVEIACMGGHGRTGTLLAMLKVRLGGMGAKAAILAVRDEYCDKTVESNSQIDAVYEIAGEAVPKHEEVKPSKSAYSGYSGYSGGTSPAYADGSDLFCDQENGGCKHSRYMHTHVIEKDFEDGLCNMSKCDCKDYVWADGDKEEWDKRNEERGKTAAKVSNNATTKIQAQQGKLQPWNKPTNRSLSDIAKDRCSCGHSRGTHAKDYTSDQSFCTGCDCDDFDLSMKITTVDPMGVV